MGNFARLIFFVILFTAGAVALATAALYPDLLRYYQYNQLLQSSRDSLTQLKSLNTRYDTLLENIEQDPNLLSRAAAVVIGVEPNDSNVVYPRTTPEQIAAAKKMLEKYDETKADTVPIPEYMQRLGRPGYRIVMFISGCGLILVAFICFVPVRKNNFQ
ncbi:MAG: hypothetical protein WC374_04990 [Phycisphaerae bacterium]|jgi:hypothetical protein